MRSLRCEIEAAWRALPEPFAAPEALLRITALVPFVPAAVHSFGFECRLAPGAYPVDFGVSLTPARGATDALAAARHDTDRWPDIAAFGARWGDRRFSARSLLPFVFLEYDTTDTSNGVPVPSVFAALDSPIDRRGDRPELSVAREVVRVLCGAQLSPTLGRQLAGCFERLPAAGRGLHAAVMLGRPARNVRLSMLLPRDSASAYFASLGALEAAESAAKLLACNLGPRHREVQLDFDVGPPIGSRIGMGITPTAPDGWPLLVEEASRLGVCDPKKAAALLDWSGLDLVEGPGVVALLRRDVSHLKLAIDADGRLELKAYLGVTEILRVPVDPGRVPALPARVGVPATAAANEDEASTRAS